MSRLHHPNIVRLLAVCTDSQPFAMITEYMEEGDLHQHLQKYDDIMFSATGKRTIKYSFCYLCKQTNKHDLLFDNL